MASKLLSVQDTILHGGSSHSVVSGLKERTTGFGLCASQVCLLHLVALTSASIGQRQDMQLTAGHKNMFYAVQWQVSASAETTQKQPTTISRPWSIVTQSQGGHSPTRRRIMKGRSCNTSGSATGTVGAVAATIEALQIGSKQDCRCQFPLEGLYRGRPYGTPGPHDGCLEEAVTACLCTACLEAPTVRSRFHMHRLGAPSLGNGHGASRAGPALVRPR